MFHHVRRTLNLLAFQKHLDLGRDIRDIAEQMQKRLKGRALRVLSTVVVLQAISPMLVGSNKRVDHQPGRGAIQVINEPRSLIPTNGGATFGAEMPIIACVGYGSIVSEVRNPIPLVDDQPLRRMLELLSA